jgi:FMN phosphatase YigB (HAD superfamily)
MSFSTLKAVVCDADGTLFQLKDPLATTYSEILGEYGYRLDKESFNTNIKRVWQDFEPEYLNEREHHKTSPERERAVWYIFIDTICKACGISEVTFDAKDALYSYYASGESRSVCQELQELLVEATDNGLAIYLASNNDMRVHSLVQALFPPDFFSGVFTAGELGWKKPSPKFFKTIEDRIHLTPHEILHMGNDKKLDIQAAENAGWRALHFSPSDLTEIKKIVRVLSEDKS